MDSPQRRIPWAPGRPAAMGGSCPRRPSALLALAVLGGLVGAWAGPGVAAGNLNASLEEICQPLQGLNTRLGASAAPGSPAGGLMQKELSLSPAQYEALWSLLKLTPTSSCRALY